MGTEKGLHELRESWRVGLFSEWLRRPSRRDSALAPSAGLGITLIKEP